MTEIDGKTIFWIGKINVVKMIIVSKAIYIFSVIPIELPIAFSTKLEQNLYNLRDNIEEPIVLKQS